MKKIFTLCLALMGFISVANAATTDDIKPLKHSYVLVCDELGARPGKGVLFGDDHFLDVTGGSTATNKGKINLASADGVLVTEEIAATDGEYGEHYTLAGLSENAQGKSKSALGASFGAGAFKTPAPAVKPAAPVSPAASASETAAPAAKPSFRPGADITSSVRNQSLNIPSFLRGSDSRRK